jgi:hypothetical protein
MKALEGRRGAVLKLVGRMLLAALVGTLVGSLMGFAVDLYISTQSVALSSDTPWTAEGAPVGAVAGLVIFGVFALRPRRGRN